MSQIIHKAILEGRVTTLELPSDTELLHCETQHGQATLWYKFSKLLSERYPDDKKRRHFQAFPTGSDKVPDNARFVGTCMFDDGYLVFHVFEVFNVSDTPV